MSIHYQPQYKYPQVILADDEELVITPQRLVIGDYDAVSSFDVNADQFVTEPLTQEEVSALHHRLRVKMITKGFRDNEQGRYEFIREIKNFLREIGKSNEGMIFRPGMGWIPDPRRP